MLKKYIYLSLGFIFLGLGCIGLVLPLMPTTPFILLTAWFFSRSSKKFENWLMNHKIFGPIIINWQEHRAIDRNSKIYSVIMIIITFFISTFFIPLFYVDIFLIILGIVLCLFIITRTELPN